jgi:CheY-like chemotaxis protein
MTSDPAQWSNLRVLVLEDEPLLLLDVQDMLGELGVASVSAFPTVEAATRATDAQAFDVALLDVVIGTQSAVALALNLQLRGTSVGFVSGTDGDFLPQALRSCPLLRKPYTPAAFRSFFSRLAA